MDFTCQICGHVLKSKVALDYHVTHNVCTKNIIMCTYCGKEFTSRPSLLYHTTNKVCDGLRNASNLKKIKLNLKKTSDEQDDLHQKLERAEKRCAQLEGENKALKEHPQTVNNNQINIVVPPAFLEIDNYDHLMKKLPNLLHNALTKHPANFISYLIKETNCNPNTPMFNSIKITNKKDPFAQISDGKQYIYVSKKNTIMQLIENKKNILEEYIDNNGDKYGKLILSKYQNYIRMLDDDKETQKDLEIDIICMLLNVSETIGADEWSKKLLEDLKKWDIVNE